MPDFSFVSYSHSIIHRYSKEKGQIPCRHYIILFLPLAAPIYEYGGFLRTELAKTLRTHKKKARVRASQRRCRFIAHTADSSALWCIFSYPHLIDNVTKKYYLKAQVYCNLRYTLVYLQWLICKVCNHLFNCRYL